MANTVLKQYGSDPATLHYVVTPSNTAMLNPIPRSLYVVTAGNLTIVDSANVSITYIVTAGQVIPFRPIRIHTDSTANVVAWS